MLLDVGWALSAFLARKNKKDQLVGGFNMESLFKEALKYRLESMGVKVESEAKKNLPVMEIGLKNFFMDYKNRKWVINISYQIRLLKDEGNIASETVKSTGERMKMLGRGNVEKFLGEIFTDGLNEPNVSKLFQQVGL